MNAEAATLVFASAYLNNPASLFGHTLLRLDRRGQTEPTRLLAYAINYAAADSNSRGLMYVMDGIAGGFKGKFEIQPYYKLVRTYSDLESRDLWGWTGICRSWLIGAIWKEPTNLGLDCGCISEEAGSGSSLAVRL